MFKFELSEQMVVVIGRALEQMPYGVVRATIEELQRQINAQRQPSAPINTNGNAVRCEEAQTQA